ncbi:MAG: 2-oxoacid:acceptor oxidoreductase subunit alpha [Candidatus Thermoplasmatota archaeon]|nr:2-oxoacid:acceptor oxidoreductase subunit alpha [Candidatus Thermoplasmatota archaeon]MBU1941091.1 2-oxoacid:acceptor oxidoreductase subunit alpha [Candidatus Thermoplasmatota archaeon]
MTKKGGCDPKGVSIVLCGAAGQGIQTVESLLALLAYHTGFFVFSTKEYMSRVRGGVNSTEIRIASSPVKAYIDRIDILVALSPESILHTYHRVSKNTMILADTEAIGKIKDDSIVDIPLQKVAKTVGSPVVANTVAVGILSAMLKIPLDTVLSFVHSFFSKKKQTVVDLNISAVTKGYTIGKKLSLPPNIIEKLSSIGNQKKLMLLNGTRAISIGALTGGCSFISSYPMSPSTGVLTTLSQLSHRFDIITEQAEDEIAAINMALGASYAGARSMVTTSGGGFALMIEGVSLAGMLEQPVVIHVAQRPGPATGLPTRTEQADLELVLYAGHGEFPRVIYTPGTVLEGIQLTHKAFNMADAYQIPVFVLTDQYFVDSYYSSEPVDITTLSNEYYVETTTKRYNRYALNKSGISPRGIPGQGTGLVAVDSDEHDETGRITEDVHMRSQMVEKRLKKLKEIKKEAVPPTFIGKKNCSTLVICWGSTIHIVNEAVECLDDDTVGILHCSQVYPLHPDVKKYLSKISLGICVENNATGQFQRLLFRETGIMVEHKILQYNGLPFSVETIYSQLHQLLRGG